MNRPSKVFVLVLAGRQQDAVAFAQRRYPAHEAVVLSKTALRESNWRSQLRTLRQLRGQALVIFTDSLASVQEPMLLKCTVLVHQCRRTVLADRSGSFEMSSKAGLLVLLPRSIMLALADLIVFGCIWVALQFFRLWLKLSHEVKARFAPLDLAFLYPSPAGLDMPGGALTHVTGFLSGLAQEGKRSAVFSGRPLPSVRDVYHIPRSNRRYLFREAAALAYNIRFIVGSYKRLARNRPRLLYQRHGRFLFAGAFLSRLLRIPLVLEYNASEEWMAKNWDPVRFSPWLRLCERVSLTAASLIVVVSNPLKQQLSQIGVPAEKILVNPNAVDPEWFHPDCGGMKLRKDLGVGSEEVVVCFVGTFSYWHGIAVLEQAIRSLDDAQSARGGLKFLLIGDGPLASQMRTRLEPYARHGSVIFTGAIAHKDVRVYLDAADILVSPHVPMPDGSAFFGSPTKLFEYMAMGKAIVASALDQIADVLEHGRTGFLVKPGDPNELAVAIRRLAANAQVRTELGRNARDAVLACHTWRRNAARVLSYYASSRRTPNDSPLPAAVDAAPSPSPQSNLAKQNL
jgi:glycosyltransferase involved in cell wall biosynthesis